jgi:hypothetical protein
MCLRLFLAIALTLLSAGTEAPDPPALQPMRDGNVMQTFVRVSHLPRVRLSLGDPRPAVAREMHATHIETRSGAPLVVPQRK